ncbi:MAG TPA: methyltransferase domain-containing protein [Candidatus Kapabacteria bacterium]|nr:methyltransferase domain-containing protein [Candidatus Kapabacteria bacterium]
MDETGPRTYSPQEIDDLHQAMVDAIVAARPFDNPLVERALRAVPRHLFLPTIDVAEVYTDKAIGTAWDERKMPISSSTQPSLMGLMIDQLDLRPGHRVLEIGAATGYNAAVLRHIVGEEGRVVTIDIDEDLVAAARGALHAAGYDDVLAVTADGSAGYPPEAPFDRILVTVGCPDIPPAWPAQLAADGVLVVPLSLIGDAQKSLALRWVDGHLESQSSIDCRFVALRGAHSGDDSEPLLLGGVPKVALHPELDDPSTIDGAAVWRTIGGDFVDYATGVTAAPREVALRLLGSIALQVPHTFWIAVTEQALETTQIPALFLAPGRQLATYGALDRDGVALVVREPGSTLDEGTEQERFVLMVRSYGSNHGPAEELVAAIRDWDDRGRRGDEHLRVAVWPAGSEPEVDETDLVIRKPASIIVVSRKGARP